MSRKLSVYALVLSLGLYIGGMQLAFANSGGGGGDSIGSLPNIGAKLAPSESGADSDSVGTLPNIGRLLEPSTPSNGSSSSNLTSGGGSGGGDSVGSLPNIGTALDPIVLDSKK